MYLFAAMRPASIASEEICSFSKLRDAGGREGKKGQRRASKREERGVVEPPDDTRRRCVSWRLARPSSAFAEHCAARINAEKSSPNPATVQTLEKTSRPRHPRPAADRGVCASRGRITARDGRVCMPHDSMQRAHPRLALTVAHAGGGTRARHPAMVVKTRCETRWGWPYLTRCTQEGKRLQSYFFMPLWMENQGKGVVVVSVRLQRACEARERRVARVAGGSPRAVSARQMPVGVARTGTYAS